MQKIEPFRSQAVSFTSTGLSIDDKCSESDWRGLGQWLRTAEGAIQFWIGDWLRHGEKKGYLSSEKYDEAEKVTGLERRTLQEYKYVADAVPSSLRNEDIGFHAHKAVASLPQAQQKKWLAKAVDEDLSVGDLRRAIAKDSRPAVNLPTGKYQVIYADPPWLYGQDQHGKEEQATVLSTHYPSMPTPDIADLNIPSVSADNAVLFLWVTSPKLYEAEAILDAWGFTYKTSMVWDKVLHNVGYYVSVRHELLLICTKGSFLPESGKLVDSVVSIERTAHSAKPERFYEIIEEMYPSAKKLELFARGKRKGWTVFGNEV